MHNRMSASLLSSGWESSRWLSQHQTWSALHPWPVTSLLWTDLVILHLLKTWGRWHYRCVSLPGIKPSLVGTAEAAQLEIAPVFLPGASVWGCPPWGDLRRWGWVWVRGPRLHLEPLRLRWTSRPFTSHRCPQTDPHPSKTLFGLWNLHCDCKSNSQKEPLFIYFFSENVLHLLMSQRQFVSLFGGFQPLPL